MNQPDKQEWEENYKERFSWLFKKNNIDDSQLLEFIAQTLRQEREKLGKTIQKMSDKLDNSK